jgi:hypothetical protein
MTRNPWDWSWAEIIAHPGPLGDLVNALAVALDVGTEYCVFVSCRHFVFLWQLQRSVLRYGWFEAWGGKDVDAPESRIALHLLSLLL